MRKIADGEAYPMPATIDDPAVLKPKFRSFDLNDVDHQWLASHLRF